MIDPADQVYEDFLAELSGLERFRQRFQQRHPQAPLDREDPDVKRLVEAMAYFSMQTRQATLANVRSTWRRLFAGFFGFLLEPLPAAAVVQAMPSEKMVEATLLTRGTELQLSPAEGFAGSFRLERDLRVLPIFLEGIDVIPQVKRGFRMILRFESRAPRRDPIDVLSLHVQHLDEYATSLSVFHALRAHLQKVTVVYDQPADESSAGSPCEVGFGRAPFAPDDAASYAHPLQRIRAFFQLPERDLFVHVKVPQPRGTWKTFALCFDLDENWNTGRSLHPEFFKPFAVPVVNLKAEQAQPVTADGKKTEYPILSLSAGRDLTLHSVTGVFQKTKAGLAPLRPSFLPGDGPSFEVESTVDRDLRARHSLLIEGMPEAFAEPRKIAVEALWHQPGFAAKASGKMTVSTPHRYVEGLNWQMLGGLEATQESPLLDDVAALTQILAWKVKPTLERDEVLALLAHLGSPAKSPLARALRWLRELTVRTAPDSAMRGSGVRHIYDVVLEPFDPAFEPIAVAFLRAVAEILDVWNAEAMVDLRATVAGRGPLTIPPP